MKVFRFPKKELARYFSRQSPHISLKSDMTKLIVAMRNAPPSEALEIYKTVKEKYPTYLTKGIFNQFLNKLAVEYPTELDRIRLDMSEAGILPDDSSYSAFIKAKAVLGDIESGMKLIEEADASGNQLKLRNFGPLLQAAYSNTPPKLPHALRLWERMLAGSIQPLEFECVSMIDAILRTAESSPSYSLLCWHAVDEVFRHYLSEASPYITAESAEKIAKSFERASKALGSSSKVEYVNLSKTGVCPTCSTQASAIGVNEEERQYLIESLFAKAQSWHASHFSELKEFAVWFNSEGRDFTVVIDAANVAYNGQNKTSGVFSYKQIDQVVRALVEEGEKPLVIIHNKYMAMRIPNTISLKTLTRQVTSEEHALRERWKDEGMLFSPASRYADDDWYWMFATVASRRGISVVTNDETRDHRPEGLNMRSFQRWRTCRVRNFQFKSDASTGRQLCIHPTAQFSREMQRTMSSSLHWHIPVCSEVEEVEKSWLCVHVAIDPVLEEAGEMVGESYLSALGRQLERDADSDVSQLVK